MNEAASLEHRDLEPMLRERNLREQDRRISEIVKREGARLASFIRRRVADPLDAEDILQDVFYRLVEANRLLMPIEHVTGWLFQVARNRVTDLFRKHEPQNFSEVEGENEEGLHFEDLLPSPEAGPEALYARNLLLDELEDALEELPAEQREVFEAHEFEGRSFKDCRRDRRECEYAAGAQAICGPASAGAIKARVRGVHEVSLRSKEDL